MRRLVTVALATLLFTPQHAFAQNLAVAAHAGSLGLGGSVIVGLTPNLNARGTVGFIPIEPELTEEDIDYTASFPTFLRATVDFYPVGFFYLSGGGLFLTGGGDITVEGQPAGDTEIGGTLYTPAEVGTLTGAFSLSSAMPYLGVGFGNPAGSGIGFQLDLGVGFGSVPTVDLSATGTLASDPTFLSELEAEERNIEDEIPSLLQYYPVASISVSFGFGG